MRFWHVGIIVKDIEKAAEYYKALPGAEQEWKVSRMSFAPETCVIGAPCTVDVAFGFIDGVPHELICPVEGEDSMQMMALKENGEHIHHLAYIAGEEQDQIVKNLEAAGATRIWENNDGVVHCIFMKAKDGGMIYELADVHPDEIVKEDLQ